MGCDKSADLRKSIYVLKMSPIEPYADDPIWKALANPVRRNLLDRLAEGPRTTGELAAGHASLSRYAVMQHLEVLVDAGLVLVRREGRRRLNYLNAVPVQLACERWLAGPAGQAARQASAFKRHVEGRSQSPQPTESESMP